jgi:hypothetical protein
MAIKATCYKNVALGYTMLVVLFKEFMYFFCSSVGVGVHVTILSLAEKKL